MGVDLSKIVIKHEVNINELSNKVIVIDAYNWLYQFLSVIRQPDGTPLMDSKGRITSHLSGLFYRTAKLLEAGIKPCYVFDGKPSPLKIVIKDRLKRKEKAMKEYKEALEKGDYARALSKASQTSHLTIEMVNEAKDLLKAMGVPFVDAPQEGEAQASHMVIKGDAYAVATQDYDALLFGAPLIIRNLSITGKRRFNGFYKIIKPELIKLSEVLEQNKLTREELILLGILLGTDYNPGGVKGIGIVKGLKLIREWGINAAKKINYEHVNELMNLFTNPSVSDDYTLEWSNPDKNKIRELLLKYDFSEDRISNTIKKITKQRGLNAFF